MTQQHLPESAWLIVKCSANCDAALSSPIHLGVFAGELADELGAEADEISDGDVARAWARAAGWEETPDGWCCPAHVQDEEAGSIASLDAAFDAEYGRLADIGECDAPGGMEHERVKAEWIAAGRPAEISMEEFIRQRANWEPGAGS